MNYIIYGFYNLVYQILSIGFLFYANTYLNNFFIPDSLRWENGKLREDITGLMIVQALILIIEAALLMMLMYYINKRFLSGIARLNNANTIATWTAGIYSVITITFIVVLIYIAFK